MVDVSLYTDVVVFFFSFFSKTSASSTREDERGARERIGGGSGTKHLRIMNLCFYLRIMYLCTLVGES